MTAGNSASVWMPPKKEPEIRTAAAIQDLISSLSCEPWGQASPSTYETARLVSLAPWLAGHTDRVRFLVTEQRPDGGWGGPEGYALIPTLSATEALIATIRGTKYGNAAGNEVATAAVGCRVEKLAGVVDRGLQALTGWLGSGKVPVPDTPAADLIVPALVSQLNEHLAQFRSNPHPGLERWSHGPRLALPAGMESHRLDAVRQLITAGAAVPQKLLHALEVVGELARGLRGVRPSLPGTIGASPAATAAWLGKSPPFGSGHVDADLAREYLESVSRRYGGPVPCTTPITVFERAWVLSSLRQAHVPLAVPPALVRSLETALGHSGAATGPGLPTDADTTSVVLHALGRLGVPADPESLWSYQTEAGFCTWPGEDGFSVTTNAHVLDALGQHLRSRPDAPVRYRSAVHRLSVALAQHQEPDGWWLDRWHASPYYATVCCVLALARVGGGPAAATAIARAVDWVIASQQADGSWGRWGGTVEETAYAMQVLLTAGTADRPATRSVARRGHDYLRNAAGRQPDPPLWHDKDLYRPAAIVRAATIATFQMGKRRPDLIGAPRESIKP